MKKTDTIVAERDLSLWLNRTTTDATKGIYHIAPCRDKKGGARVMRLTTNPRLMKYKKENI